MKCPFCQSIETKVVDKREIEDNVVTRRRRECLNCEKRFTTYERIEMSNILVIKKDGKREQFDREKVKKGIIRACEKRNVSMEEIDKVVQDLEQKLRNMESTEVKSKVIGEFIMKSLKKIDKVAYIRFASVYKDFEDIESFKQAIEKLGKK
ncbi:transcriptional repressor NrdR [Candidatus Woesearchaeota archaeon]|jgi:transcriptional repressor NrdR|nr:transcriptional repressor NrdR [Candidatus Woesearchaeota archaeon]